ncbi:uncharacterized protein LOC131234558 [Magnolia sinica]|uniref:uncharacterized protein LOC131234558 n=1 Tax=Magnolia sinica TaxID=86752 RepID=UPI0026590DAE|nr:uncharacterized protein LOC131234558 [Magnolia sinica]
MPRVDLETLFRGNSGDRRIVCETLFPADQRPEKRDLPALDPELPAESFRIPIRDEIEWVDRNAFFERKRSTKGISNWANWNPISNPKSKSQRISSNLKSNSKPSIIIGLPKRRDTGQMCQNFRRSCRPASIRELMKSAGPGPVTEPASPKVSCIGRVRAKDKARGHRRRDSSVTLAPAGKSGKEKVGLWAKFKAVFRFRQRRRSMKSEENPANESSLPVKSFPADVGTIPAMEFAAPAPGLGGLKKFASGHRPASWGGDVDLDLDFHVADKNDSGKGSLRRRPSLGPVNCGRDFGDVGPATC